VGQSILGLDRHHASLHVTNSSTGGRPQELAAAVMNKRARCINRDNMGRGDCEEDSIEP